MHAMASHVVSGLVLVWLLICLLAIVSGAQGRELRGRLTEERKLLSLYNDSTVSTTTQKELIPRIKGLAENASQRNLQLSKIVGYSREQSSSRKPYPSYYHIHAEGSQRILHWATYHTRPGNYYGTKASINVWSVPEIKYNQVSSAEIWVSNGDDVVQAGWHVFPEKYHDTKTHFFTRWTTDKYQKTGCFNLECLGFVFNNSSRLVPGIVLHPLSDYDGNQCYLTLKIYKDPQTGDWLLFEGSGYARNFIGYWPKFLFTNLVNSASRIEWGGTIAFTQPGMSPPMGSGHFPSEREGKAASFKNIQYVTDKGYLDDPDGSEVDYEDKEDCYQAGPFVDTDGHGGPSEGWVFYFGGPGGCNN